MKITLKKSLARARAFTIIELLIVIAIIGILAAMLMPVLSAAQKHAKVTQAKTEIANIVNAIQQYESDYSRFPVSAAVQNMGVGQYTYGGIFQSTNGVWWVGTTNANNQIATNSDVMAILLDYTNYPNNYLGGATTINTNHMKNPKRNVYLANTKPSGWDPTMGGTPLPGIGNDLVYRDPWGNPYIITMDLNEDNQAFDSIYERVSVATANNTPGATGLAGLVSQPNGYYAFHGNVMVWSAGPDGKIAPDLPANVAPNRDNVLSWQ